MLTTLAHDFPAGVMKLLLVLEVWPSMNDKGPLPPTIARVVVRLKGGAGRKLEAVGGGMLG